MNACVRRVVAAGAVLLLASTLVASSANATANTQPGVGSAGGGILLTSVDAGTLAKIALLGESNAASIDPAVGPSSAIQTIAPLDLSSQALPALDAASAPHVQTTSTGPQDQKGTVALDLGTVGQPVPVVSGSIVPAALSSVVDTAGAASTLTGGAANAGLLGGVAHLDAATLNVNALAAPTSSSATRLLALDNLTAIDLRGLLNLLGLDLNDLSLDQLAGLVTDLGLVDALNTATGTSFVTTDDIVTAVNDATDAVASAQSALDQAIALGNQCECLPVDVLTGVLNDAQQTLTTLTSAIANVLTTAPLLKIDSAQIGAAALAQDTVADSSATVTGVISHVHVGTMDLGGVDATATLDQINALGATVDTTISGILGAIDPALANVVHVELLKQATSVFQSGAYVNAVAGITTLVVTITPIDICAVLNGLPSSADITVPASTVTPLLGVDALDSIVDCPIEIAGSFPRPAVQGSFPVEALQAPVTFKVGQVNSVADFAAAPVPAPTTTTTVPEAPPLPRTGGDTTLLLIAGLLLSVLALGARRTAVAARR